MSGNSVILPAQRIDRILSLLAVHGFRTNQALAKDLQVSEMTIRRDVSELAEQGQVERVRGGVRAKRRTDPIDLPLTDEQFVIEGNLAEAAASLVEDGETVFLDGGRISVALARALGQRRLPSSRVVTNSVGVAAVLCTAMANVVQLGGEVRQNGAVIGQQALRLLDSMRFDRCFLSADAFDIEFGISGKHLPEIEIKRVALQQSAWTALVAPSACWGLQSMLRIGNLRDIQCLVTDDALPDDARQSIADRKVRVFVAGRQS